MNNGYSHPQGGSVDEQAGISWDGRCWRVADYDLIGQISRDKEERFASRPLHEKQHHRPGSESLLFEQALFLDGERHQAMRKVLDLAFVQLLHPTSGQLEEIRATCSRMIRERVGRLSMDLVTDLAWPLTDTILSKLSGVPLLTQEMRDGAEAVADWTSGHKKEETPSQIERFKMHLMPLLATRRRQVEQERPADLLSVVLSHAPDADEETLLANVMMLAAAGRHALSNTLTQGVWLLLQEADLWARLHEATQTHPRLLHLLVERLLCLATPTTQIARWASQALLLEGKSIERGHKLILDLAAANRGICAHLDQTTQELSKPLPRPHLSFGPAKDPHFCPGARLSREVLRHTLHTLIQEMPTLRLCTDEQPQRTANPTIGGIVSLPVCWHP